MPQTRGWTNCKSNLVSACRTCNTKKNDSESESFLLDNYRKVLLTQEEYESQKKKLNKLKEEYTKIKITARTLRKHQI